MRNSVVFSLVVLFLYAGLAFGQLPSGNVFLGYSHTDTNLVPRQSTGLNGWNVSVEGKALPLLGIVGDLSGYYGSQDFFLGSASVSEYNFLFGPRLSFRVKKFRPFAHALIGAGHTTEFTNSHTSFADALGGGLDYRLISRISWRIQLDALETRFFSRTQNNVRFSTGIALHF